jgi:PhnB protein
MQLNPYVHFDGRCEEAFNFYQTNSWREDRVMLRYEGMPSADHVPAEWRSKIGHAHLNRGCSGVYGLRCPAELLSEAAGLFGLDPRAGMPIQETFWAVRFGMLTDRYGIPWMVNCGKEA